MLVRQDDCCVECFLRSGYGVRFQKIGSSVVFVLQGGSIVVPVKIGYAILFQRFHQAFFCPVQNIETHKYDFLIGENQSGIGTFGYFSEYHAFIAHTIVAQVVPKPFVKGVQNLPKRDKMAFIIAFADGHEVFPETTYIQNLFFGERTAESGIDFFQVVNVGKKLSGIDHIFIYIVEVVEKGFSQWNKFIETLFLRT